MKYTIFALLIVLALACQREKAFTPQEKSALPVIVTDTTPNDTDDPAIWYNRQDPSQSLVIGTDKGDSTGGIFVFNLDGKLIPELCITGLNRPNNVDIAYDFPFNGKSTDIAVFTERGRDMIRVVSIPDFKFIDGGGIQVFADDDPEMRAPMGIALYKNPSGAFFAFVSRKNGPSEGYLHQYELIQTDSAVGGLFVRAFGAFSGKKEIESIVVDQELGYVYYSDERTGVRKYHADAEKGNDELSLFATTEAKGDHEGLSIYKGNEGEGYIILSDQQANRFLIFTRKGTSENPHQHQLIQIVNTKTLESDGSDITHLPLNQIFPNGLFVAMSADKTFQFYRAEDIVPIK